MRFFPALIVAGFAVFLVLQIWIVQTTGASIRRYQAASQGRGDSGFRLTVGREVYSDGPAHRLHRGGGHCIVRVVAAVGGAKLKRDGGKPAP